MLCDLLEGQSVHFPHAPCSGQTITQLKPWIFAGLQPLQSTGTEVDFSPRVRDVPLIGEENLHPFVLRRIFSNCCVRHGQRRKQGKQKCQGILNGVFHGCFICECVSLILRFHELELQTSPSLQHSNQVIGRHLY